jgi:hypothetical protein
MYKAKIRITGKSPLSQSRYYEQDAPKNARETPSDYEKRTWMHRLHVNDQGNVYIPRMTFPNMLLSSAKRLGMKFKGNSTFSSRFKGGILAADADLDVGVKAETVPGEWLFVPSDGQTGGSKRVLKCFPRVDKWGGDIEILVLDEAITKPVLLTHLKNAGDLIGCGRFRPERGGYYGRFDAEILSFEEVE